MSDTTEQIARRIAEQGRDELVARLRPAFEAAAAAHADVLELDDDQLERMVQRAADRADGLQWRRALAAVASRELDVGLGEALGHPAVLRAHEIVGAPSYEESLAALSRGRPPAREETPAEEAPAAGEEPAAEEEPGAEDEPAAESVAEEEPPAAPARRGRQKDEETEETELYREHDEPEEEHTPRTVRVRAVHLGGIANLPPSDRELELWFSDEGLDVVRRPSRAILGRLTWDEIVSLETSSPRGRLRRKRQADCQLIIRSKEGDATFEIPGLGPEELRRRLGSRVGRA